ncbi:type VI secretion system baseplate subunit TssK [Janthinobacterium fluminis]|uniref:Type VI secretion system baseplate subunit TssK n=1 Tax=Janthinobacterium fluminis TaxID=2987524 RepID=A0ABT5JX83_9BURK|nr:type VI secretion system baseplate subunit TssK [Janthinobacterium fluminis]MDC8756671.1 type VI secretion system baseplate subunit TssK [Janthinobacterium fluminis]
MDTPGKILWSEGLFLRIQHFQQQDRNHAELVHLTKSAIHPFVWGVGNVEIDTAALTTDTLRLTALSCLFPDGEVYAAPSRDALPTPVRLADLPAATQTLTFYAALPCIKEHGENCDANTGARYTQKTVTTQDLFTTAAAAPISYLKPAVRLISDVDVLGSYSHFPLLRLQRKATGGFELDKSFMPPSLTISAAPGLHERICQLEATLQAKVDSLYAHHSEPRQNVIELRTRDVASFWMLHTASTGYAALSHFMGNPDLHPEQLFREMLVLAGGLMTYSKTFTLRELPAYRHGDPGPGFAALEHIIHELLGTVISSQFLAIPLPMEKPSFYRGSLDAEKIDRYTQLYVAVNANMPAVELVELVPLRFMVGSPDDVGTCVQLSLPGVRLVHAPQVPTAIPVRPSTLYFELEHRGELYEKMLKAKAIMVYVPNVFHDIEIELIAITS